MHKFKFEEVRPQNSVIDIGVYQVDRFINLQAYVKCSDEQCLSIIRVINLEAIKIIAQLSLQDFSDEILTKRLVDAFATDVAIHYFTTDVIATMSTSTKTKQLPRYLNKNIEKYFQISSSFCHAIKKVVYLAAILLCHLCNRMQAYTCRLLYALCLFS